MVLTTKNFRLFAARTYNNPACVDECEFEDDLNRIRDIHRLCTRYRTSGVLRCRLLLNHFTIVYNLWGPAATPMLYFRIPEYHWPVITPFIQQLGYLPYVVPFIEPKLCTGSIHVDETVVRSLNTELYDTALNGADDGRIVKRRCVAE